MLNKADLNTSHVDKGHLQTSEQYGPKAHFMAKQQVEDVLKDGETTTDGSTADDTVDEEHDLLTTG